MMKRQYLFVCTFPFSKIEGDVTSQMFSTTELMIPSDSQEHNTSNYLFRCHTMGACMCVCVFQ